MRRGHAKGSAAFVGPWVAVIGLVCLIAATLEANATVPGEPVIMRSPRRHVFALTYLQSMDIMADKGFYISNLLFRRGCGLLQPIEKPKLKRYSRSALLYSRRVSHVRIHIERMVRRVNARCGWLHKQSADRHEPAPPRLASHPDLLFSRKLSHAPAQLTAVSHSFD